MFVLMMEICDRGAYSWIITATFNHCLLVYSNNTTKTFQDYFLIML